MCKQCCKSKVQRDNSGMINLKCTAKDCTVNGFEKCNEFEKENDNDTIRKRD